MDPAFTTLILTYLKNLSRPLIHRYNKDKAEALWEYWTPQKKRYSLYRKLTMLSYTKNILDLQSDALKIMEENSKLRERIKNLEETFKIKGTLIFENNHYYVGENKEGPYCTICWDKDQNLVH